MKPKRASAAIGVSVAGDETFAVYVRADAGGARSIRTARVPWTEDEAASLENLHRTVAPDVKAGAVPVAFVLEDPSQTLEVKTFPSLDAGDFQKAAAWHFQRHRRTFLEKPAFGAWMQSRSIDGGDGPEKIEAVLLETDGDEVERRRSAGRRIGCKRCSVIPQAFALASVAGNETSAGAPDAELVLRQGDGKGTMTVLRGDHVLLHRNVDLEPDPFEMPLPSTEGGVGTLTVPDLRISAAKLLVEIRRTEQYLSTRLHTSPCSIAVIDGGPELVRLLADETGLAVRELPLPETAEGPMGPDFALALGAALRVMDPYAVGLLPQEGAHAPKRTDTGVVDAGLALRAFGRAIPLVLVAFLGAQLGWKQAERANERLESTVESIARQAADPAMERRMESWQERALVLNRYRSHQYRWSDAMRSLALAVPPRVVLRQVSAAAPPNTALDESWIDLESDGGDLDWLVADDGEDEERPSLVVRGMAPTLAEVRLFLADLNDRPEFRAVRLAAAGLSDDDGDPEGSLTFEVDCEPAVQRSTLAAGGAR